MSKRAIILSGGGSKGAWGVGVVKALFNQGITYQIGIGTSTGSLMAPFILAGAIDELEQGYTSVNQDDIFNVNPFKNDGGIKGLQAAFRLIGGKKTLGESVRLREKIEELVSNAFFTKIRNEEKLFGATVANLNKGVSEVKTTDQYSDAEMKDWIWASANNPLFMSSFEFTESNGQTYSYADGGITNYANVEYVILNRPKELTHIDVIFHNTREVIQEGFDNNSGILSRLLRTLDMFSADANKNDLVEARLRTQLLENDVHLTIYYMNDEDVISITGESRNTLLFDKQRMQVGVMRGNYAIESGTIDKDECIISCTDGRVHLQTTP